jgi:putative membrane protein
MIKRIGLVWASNAIAILVAEVLISGIRMENEWRVIVAGAVFGLVNWAVKPIVTILSLPVIILSFGIALFFVNLLMLYITSWLISDFRIDSFGAGVAGTIVIWLVNLVLYAVFGLDDRRAARSHRASRRS